MKIVGIAGRNIHALDPYRMPSLAALERGTAVGKAILDSHQAANNGAWPETVSVSLSYLAGHTKRIISRQY